MGRSRATLAGIGLGLVVLNLTGLAVHSDWAADYGFVAVTFAQGGLYAVAAMLIRRQGATLGQFQVVIVVAALLRVALVFTPPLHSSDIYRYVWDGRVQAAGINPYRYVPADPALSPLHDESILPHINRADYAVTIYPPVAQIAFLGFTRIAEAVWSIKVGWLALEAIAMFALVRLLARLGRPPAELLLYAWHPLPVWEIAGDGHVDAGMMAFLVLALWAWSSRRRLIVGMLLTASVLIKPLTLAALPAFWRRWDWRVPAAFVVTAALAYLPYLGIGEGIVGFLPSYVDEEGMRSGGGFYLLALLEHLIGSLPAGATIVYLIASAALLAVLALGCIVERNTDVVVTAFNSQILLLAALLILSPNYPWYFLILVPLGCLRPWLPAQVLTLLSFVLYAAPPIDSFPRTFLVQSVLYGGTTAALLFDLGGRIYRAHIARNSAILRQVR